MKRFGILTSGGDCQGLNAAIRGVAKGLYGEFGTDQVELYGIKDGYSGLIYGNVELLNPACFSGILTLGGTILGTSRRPYKKMRTVEEDGVDKVAAMIRNYNALSLDCLVILGGNGTQKTANLLREEGLHVIHLPKTIDNDIYGTDVTFGFQSAVEVATHVLDCIHTTATSHGRVFIVELMGHKVGWLTLAAGIAGGADVILIPEIPYDLNSIAAALKVRQEQGKKFSILAVAEGAISKEDALLPKKDLKRKRLQSPYPSVAYQLEKNLGSIIENEVRICLPGHFQRGGSPCAYDRILCTKLGARAAKLIREENYGNMVGVVGGKTVPVPLNEAAGRLKAVPTGCDEVETAKEIGVVFGE